MSIRKIKNTFTHTAVTYPCNESRAFSGNAGGLAVIAAVKGHRVFLVFKIGTPRVLDRIRILQVHFEHLFGVQRRRSIQKGFQRRRSFVFFHLSREKGCGKPFLRHPPHGGGRQEASLRRQKKIRHLQNNSMSVAQVSKYSGSIL